MVCKNPESGLMPRTSELYETLNSTELFDTLV